jgi:hypothetical protein
MTTRHESEDYRIPWTHAEEVNMGLLSFLCESAGKLWKEVAKAKSRVHNAQVCKRRTHMKLNNLVSICLLAMAATADAVWAQVQAAPALSGVIGAVQSFTGSSLEVMSKSGVVRVSVTQPLTTYKQIPSDLSHVTSTSYVGVGSVEQADGTQRATQILIFPEELRGAAEGSVITGTTPGTTTQSRMTNGSISRPAVSHSRMTNGTVQKGSGTTLVVRYQDGAQTISVPPNVPVTAVVPEKVTLAAGDTVYVATEKLPNGTLMTNKIFLIAAPTPHNTNQ